MKFTKRLIGLVMVLIMMFLPKYTTLAASEQRYQGVDELTKRELINYALNFANEVNNEYKLDVEEIVPVYDNCDKLIGYSIGYRQGEIPYGYINLNFNYDDPVIEFVIQKNARSMYACLKENAKEIDNRCTVEKKIYSNSPFEYCIPMYGKDNERFFLSSISGVMTSEEYELKKVSSKNSDREVSGVTMVTRYDSSRDLFSDSYEPGSIVIISPTYTSKYSSSQSLLSQYEIMTTTGKYACAVVALTEIANQEGILLNSSITDTFDTLWTETSTTISAVKEYYNMNIICGRTADNMIAPGMKSYCEDRGKSNTLTTTRTDPSFAFFQGAMNHNRSATLSYRINLTDGSVFGHTVNVVGYCTARKDSATSSYLLVADGWYVDAPKYLNYSSVEFAGDAYGVIQ